MKKLIYLLIIASLCLAGCKDDLRTYTYEGGFMADDGEFYELHAIFMPTKDGYDIFSVSQKDSLGNRMDDFGGGCIVKTDIRSNDFEIVHQELLPPAIKIKLRDGTTFSGRFDYMIGTDDSICLMTYPNSPSGEFSVIFNKGGKFGLNLYDEKK